MYLGFTILGYVAYLFNKMSRDFFIFFSGSDMFNI